MALEAGEFAKEHGKYEPFHEGVFRAFFTECKDIGQRDVLMEIASSLGLDTDTLTENLDNHTYLKKLEETTRKAKNMMVSAAPTFIIDGGRPITGAQPLDTFRTVLEQIQS